MGVQQLYLIQHRERDSILDSDVTGFHKIGISSDPKQRRKNLGGGTPHKLRLITTLEIHGDAEAVESGLHQAFRSDLYAKEWFRLSERSIRAFKQADSISEAAVDEILRKYDVIRHAVDLTDLPPIHRLRDEIFVHEVVE